MRYSAETEKYTRLYLLGEGSCKRPIRCGYTRQQPPLSQSTLTCELTARLSSLSDQFWPAALLGDPAVSPSWRPWLLGTVELLLYHTRSDNFYNFTGHIIFTGRAKDAITTECILHHVL
jgi:hypothetical protein